jgi:hypothetical protein
MRWLSLLLVTAGCTGGIGAAAGDDVGPRSGGAGAAAVRPAGTSAPGPGAPGSCDYTRQRIWRLTPSQIRHNLEALFGARAIDPSFESDLGRAVPPLAPFRNAEGVLTASPGFVQEVFEAARDLVRAADLGSIAPCLKQAATRACVSTLVGDVGLRAWRRPVTADELQDYLGTFDQVAAKSDAATGAQYVLRRILTAPDMLFRFELGAPAGTGVFALGPYELASGISYALTDGPPDAELLAAAQQNALGNAASIEKQVRRLLSAPETGSGVQGFIAELFKVTASAHPDQPEEARRFVEQAIWRDPAGGKLQTLLTAEYSFASAALQKLYGWNRASTAKSFELVTPPASEARAGILTRGGVIASFSNRSARGRFMREVLLCQSVPRPPIDVDQDLEAQKQALAAQTGRAPTEDEVRMRHMADPACSGCHRLIDPMGKPYLAFDAAGVWRARNPTTGTAFDLRSDIAATPDMDGAVKDPRDLARALAGSRAVRACVAQQAFQFAAGRDLTGGDRCAIDAIAARFEASAGDVKELFVQVLTSDAFRLRRAATN